MMPLPEWWLILSGICCFVIIVSAIAIVFFVIYSAKHLKNTMQKTDALVDHLNLVALNANRNLDQVHDLVENINKPTTDLINHLSCIAYRISDSTGQIMNTASKTTSLLFGMKIFQKIREFFANRKK